MNNICTFLSAVGTDEENQERDEKTRLVLFFLAQLAVVEYPGYRQQTTRVLFSSALGSGVAGLDHVFKSVGLEKCTSTNQGSRYMVHVQLD